MREEERLTDLVGDIYDAALDPSLWTGALRRAAAFVGGSAASFYVKTVSGALTYHDCGGSERRFVQAYFDKYAALDPVAVGRLCAAVVEPVSTAELIPQAEFHDTRFYQEWSRPQGLVDCVGTVLHRSATSVSVFGVVRHESDGLADGQTRRRMRLIVPHMRRAVLMGEGRAAKAAEASMFADTLDRLAAGVVLVEASGRIAHANIAARAILDAGDVLWDAGGYVVAYDTRANRTFAALFAGAASQAAGSVGSGDAGMAVPLIGRSGERYAAHVLPLTAGARGKIGAAYAAVAALFVHKTAMQAPFLPAMMAKTYDLTPGELRVLLTVVEAGGVQETAAALGIAETTVKWHLRHLFEKTGTHRQAELVKLAARFCNPLLG